MNGSGFCCDDNPKLKSFSTGKNDNPELFQYYYHSDHLGSSSLITNLDGEVVQHIEYVPFGEVFIEERNNKWNTPYLFNAKELDEETGLYYYGARYYDPRVSIWLSADPMQEKYPNISTYAYTFLNPVKFIDPDGKDGIATFSINDNGDVSVEINVNIYIYGSGASSSQANQMQSNIMNDWDKGWTYKDKNGKEYSVSFNVKVALYDTKDPKKGPGFFSNKNNPFNRDNFIEVGATSTDVQRSYVTGGDEGQWRGYGVDPSSHEFGHIIGLDDHYTDATGTDPAWVGNIMGEPAGKGVVEQKNIDALMAPLVKQFNDKKDRNNARNITNQTTYNIEIDENNPKW